jgi:hypothetical protein
MLESFMLLSVPDAVHMFSCAQWGCERWIVSELTADVMRTIGHDVVSSSTSYLNIPTVSSDQESKYSACFLFLLLPFAQMHLAIDAQHAVPLRCSAVIPLSNCCARCPPHNSLADIERMCDEGTNASAPVCFRVRLTGFKFRTQPCVCNTCAVVSCTNSKKRALMDAS